MKHDAKSRGCRVDLSVPELELLVHMALSARNAIGTGGSSPPHRHLVDEVIAGLTRARDAQRRLVDGQRSAAAARRTRAAGPNKAWERSLDIDGYSVTATRGDYVDVGTLDFQAWQDVHFLTAMNKMPEQAETRRNVWLVTVFNLRERRDDGPYILASDTTDDADAGGIELLARQLIAGAQA